MCNVATGSSGFDIHIVSRNVLILVDRYVALEFLDNIEGVPGGNLLIFCLEDLLFTFYGMMAPVCAGTLLETTDTYEIMDFILHSVGPELVQAYDMKDLFDSCSFRHIFEWRKNDINEVEYALHRISQAFLTD